MSSPGLCLEDFRIPLEEIISATKNFSRETLIGASGFSRIYKGKFSERLQNRTAAVRRHKRDGYHGKNEFLNQLKLVITFQHENIIPFIGYCDEGDETIIVIEYAINGSLDRYIRRRTRTWDLNILRSTVTWVQRLKICIGAAKGLNYLPSGLGEDKVAIHRIINSGSILLDENMEAKITGFSLLISVTRDQPKIFEPSAGSRFYLDPIYHESGILKAEADVYSFGVVLFEILCGMVAYERIRIGKDKPRHMISLVRRYYDNELYKIIDPTIRDYIAHRSLITFQKMAYKCISFNTNDRPAMDKVIKALEEALDIQNRETSTITKRIRQDGSSLQQFLFPIEKIKSATNSFSSEFLIGDGVFTKVYKGEILIGTHVHVAAFKRYDLNGGQGKGQFLNELELISRFKHGNMIHFIGYCDEDGEMIIVYEYAINGSLDRFLQDPDRRRCLTWEQRLKICLGAARALSYLHSDLKENRDKVILKNFKSGKILLNHDMEAKVSGLDMSVFLPKNQSQVYAAVRRGTKFYIDPIYQESGILQTESNTYSFGIVLFEILSGMLAYHKRTIGDEKPQNLTNLVRRYYYDAPKYLIDPLIRDQIDDRSFGKFKGIAYKCISYNLKDRPSMNRVIKRIKEALDIQRYASTLPIPSIQSPKLEIAQISLEEIRKATNNFSEHIGSGGFGTVFKGTLSDRWNNRVVAIKRLDWNSKQGKNEFYNEIELISRFHHENIIAFIGYCNEGNEMMLVYEYAINGSLDSHLEHPKKDHPIPWAERLKICIGAARGLRYLHLGGEDNKTVIHRDVNSGNILLNEKFEAKISDFGLSKSGPDDEPHSKFYTKAAGTQYYIDP